jgi:hypothetical protein
MVRMTSKMNGHQKHPMPLTRDDDVEPLTLMLKALRGTHLAFKLGPNLAEELIEPVPSVPRRDRPYPAMSSVQRHDYSD